MNEYIIDIILTGDAEVISRFLTPKMIWCSNSAKFWGDYLFWKKQSSPNIPQFH